MAERTSIQVSAETARKLHQLKLAWELTTLDEVIRRMCEQNAGEVLKALDIELPEGGN